MSYPGTKYFRLPGLGVGGSFSHFHAASEKSSQITGWCPSLEFVPPVWESPGCAAALSVHFGKIVRKMLP